MKKTSVSLYIAAGVFAVLFLYLASKMPQGKVNKGSDVSAETAVQKMVGSDN